MPPRLCPLALYPNIPTNPEALLPIDVGSAWLQLTPGCTRQKLVSTSPSPAKCCFHNAGVDVTTVAKARRLDSVARIERRMFSPRLGIPPS